MDSPRQNPRNLKDHKTPPSPSTSPNSSSTSSTSSTTNGPPSGPPPPPQPSPSSLPPLTPKSNPNPNPNPTTPNPYPTTFIQADTQSFKQVVQMLTGSAETAAKRSTQTQTQTQTNPPNSNFAPAQPQKSQIPPINRPNKKPAFKLYERRSSMKNLKMISPLIPSFPNCAPPAAAAAAAFSPRQHYQPEILSPSILDFPKLVLSPVTPLSPDPFNRSPSQLGISPEDRAIAEKGFYLHPSPRPTTPREGEPPKLLPLFPLSSPRMESSAAAAAAAAESSA